MEESYEVSSTTRIDSSAIVDKLPKYWEKLSQVSRAQPTLHCFPAKHHSSRSRSSIYTDDHTSHQIAQFCRRNNVSIPDLVYGAWAIVSARHMSGTQRNTVFTVTNRHQSFSEQWEEIVQEQHDYPLVLTVSEDHDALSWIREIGLADARASSHAHVGYRKILETLSLDSPQVKVSINKPQSRPDTVSTDAEFAMVLEIIATNNEFKVSACHTSSVHQADVCVLMEHFHAILQHILECEGVAILDLQMMPATEMHLLRQYGTAYQSPRTGLVHHLIEKQAESTPHLDAVQFEQDIPLTFSALNTLSNQVARQIRVHGTSIVPVHMYPSVNLIVALLAILKAGASYVILDPDATATRRSYMVNDTGAKFVLVDKATAGEWSAELNIEALVRLSMSQDGTNLDIDQPDSDIAYVIYTSGSTGNPKAAELQHRAAFNGIHAFPRKSGLRQLLFYNPVFSAAQRSIWATLSVGGCLCLASKNNVTLHLAKTINTMEINSIDMTSTTAALISPDQVPSLQQLVLGGEMVNATVIQKWAHRVKLYSSYGLSECTQLNWRSRLRSEGSVRNIGQPLDTTTSYILTPDTTSLSPLLIPGELCLGGDQLARGYLNLPGQTADRFIENPFGHGRLYRTGDMAVRHSDGSIELLGRIDFQVKINGQRIDPGEPNSIIQSHHQVDNSVVVPVSLTGRVHLAAVIVRSTASESDEWSSLVERLRAVLRSSIPSYMIPSFWVPLSALPLNANGKVSIGATRDMVQELGDSGKLLPDMQRPEQDGSTFSNNETIIRRISAELLSIPENRISLEDSFVSLGGTSLEAIQIISRLRAEHGLVLQIEDVLLGSSLADIAKNMIERVEEPATQKEDSLEFSTLLRNSHFLDEMNLKYEEVEDAYGVTPFQEAAIADTMMGRRNYIYSRFYQVKENSMASIRDGLLALAKSDALLRTTFVSNASSFIQVVKKAAEVPWEELIDVGIEDYLRIRAYAPMRSGKLWWRAAALSGSVLVITSHHALFDYWSNEFWYQALNSILKGAEPAQRPSFRPYIEYLRGYDKVAMETFWRDYLGNAKPSVLGPRTGNEVTVTSQLHSNLKDTASSLGVTPSVLLYTAWSLALATAGTVPESNATFDVTFGITISGRDAPIPDILHMTGPTIMIAPLRVKLDLSKSLQDLLDDVRNILWKTARHAQYGLRNILKASQQGKHLVDSMVNVLFKVEGDESKDRSGAIQGLVALKEKVLGGLGSVDNVKLEFTTDQPDLVTLVSDLDPKYASVLVDTVTTILDAAAAKASKSGAPVGQMYFGQRELAQENMESTEDVDADILSDRKTLAPEPVNGSGANGSRRMDSANGSPVAEEDRLETTPSVAPQLQNPGPYLRNGKYGETRGEPERPKEASHELAYSAFQRVAALYPGKVAVEDNSGSCLTYAGLSIKANKLAALLRSKGLVLDQVVPIMLEKSINTVVAIYGIMVAGGAFLPLGPENPRARNLGILEDLEGSIAVVDRSSASFFDGSRYEVIILEDLEWDALPMERVIVPDLKPTNLAYVIYTSGSTGKPKGTLLMHEGVVCATEAINEATQTTLRHKMLWVPNYTFDGALDTLFTTLSIGCTLCVAPQGEVAANLAGLINTMKANRANMTPSMTTLMDPKEVPSLEVLLMGGEPMTPQIVEAWWPRVTIYNSYGPTEATISISTKKVEQGVSLRNVGRPYESVTAMIVDPDTMMPMRHGDVGELCISGPQLARGYLKRPEATEKAFSIGPNGTAYRTGDLARFLPNGDIELFGRRDDQVKINGYRIELEEIESVVRRTGLFEKCVVIAVTVLKRKQLVALYTKPLEAGHEEAPARTDFALLPGKPEELEQVKGQLSTIPSYMIPTIWLPFSKFPLSPAGKIDKKILKKVVEEMPDEKLKTYLPTQEVSECITESEILLQSIWSALFDTPIEAIHANSSFHALGGDSISALNLVSMLRRHKYELKVSEIVSRATLRQQARLMDESGDSGQIAQAPEQLQYQPSTLVYDYLSGIGISRDEVEDIYPCSPGQIEFLTQGNKQDQYWQLMAVREIPNELDFDRWIELTRKLTQENQILRALYLQTDTNDLQTSVQVVLNHSNLNLSYQSFSTAVEKQQILDQEWDTRFDPAKPFVRYTCLSDARSGQRFIVVKLDHASYDGTLLHIFDAQFKAFHNGITIEKHTPFKQFIGHVLSQPKQPQLDYWTSLLSDKNFAFPATNFEPKITETASARVSVELSIDTIATSTGVTSPIVFQTAFSLLLSHLSGNQEVIYDNLVAGRNVALDSPQLINGNCANFLPFYSALNPEKPIAELLKETQSAFWTATENGFVSLGEIYSSLGKERSDAAARCLFCFQPFEPVTGEQDSMRWIVMKMSKVTMHFNYAVQLEIMKGANKGEYIVRFGYDGRIFTKDQVQIALEWYLGCLEMMSGGGLVKDFGV